MAKLMIEPSEYDALIEIVEVLAEETSDPSFVIRSSLGLEAEDWFGRIFYDGFRAEDLFS